MPVEFNVENMADVLPEIKPLHLAQWAELAGLLPDEPFNPDYDRYCSLQQSGGAMLATARRDGRLIGCCQFYINRDMWTQQRYASCELLYVIPEERKGWMAINFFRYAHDALRHNGIRSVRGFSAVGNRAARTMLKKLGYTDTEQSLFVRQLP